MRQLDKAFTIKSFTEEGWFSGYASVYDYVDLHHDVVEKGAFADTLKTPDAWPKFLWQHDPAYPLGKWERIEERDRGLYVEGRFFLDLPKAQEAFLLLKEKVVNALSIGFHVEKSRRLEKGRLLQKVRLHEISLVTFPANPEARILTFKTTDPWTVLLDQLERLRRKVRYSLS